VPSCLMSVRSAQGREITTLEGLGTADALHPLQQAFIQEQAVQCGFCTSGMILASAALLGRNPQPTDAEIRAELAAHLCRCGVYDRILRAVRRAAGLPVASPTYRVEEGDALADRPDAPAAGPAQARISTRGCASTPTARSPSSPARWSWGRT
jgi:nicotinate dehydrogenase subunit A